MTKEVSAERRGQALWITVDRSEARNAMTFAMYDRLAELCREANADRTVRAPITPRMDSRPSVAFSIAAPSLMVVTNETMPLSMNNTSSICWPTSCNTVERGSSTSLSSACSSLSSFGGNAARNRFA